MNNIEKSNNIEDAPFKGLLDNLKKDLNRDGDEKNKLNEKYKASENKELLTLEQEILNKYKEYDKKIKEKLVEEQNNLPVFKKALKSLKLNIVKDQKFDKNQEKPQLEVYNSFKEGFDKLEKKVGREKVLFVIENIVASGLRPREDTEKGKADKGRVDSIIDLYNEVPNFLSELLF